MSNAKSIKCISTNGKYLTKCILRSVLSGSFLIYSYTCFTVSQISPARGIKSIINESHETTSGIEVIQASNLLLLAGLLLMLVNTFITKRVVSKHVVIPPVMLTTIPNLPKAANKKNCWNSTDNLKKGIMR